MSGYHGDNDAQQADEARDRAFDAWMGTGPGVVPNGARGGFEAGWRAAKLEAPTPKRCAGHCRGYIDIAGPDEVWCEDCHRDECTWAAMGDDL